MKYEVNPHYPFPFHFGDREQRRGVCEIDEGDDYCYLHINAYGLDDRQRDFFRRGLFSWPFTGLINQFGRELPEEVVWLYHVFSYRVAKRWMSDQDAFYENTREPFNQWFLDFNEALDFCVDKYGVAAEDFTKEKNTHIPQY